MNPGATVEVRITQTVLLVVVTGMGILHAICVKDREYVLPVEVMEYVIILTVVLLFVLIVIMGNVDVVKEQAKFMD